MPKQKKRYIDKKNAVTFHLVHRSQQDPLVTDEKAPQHVLVQQESKESKKVDQKEEQKKYGIYFDDDYDYLQHLRERKHTVNHWQETPAPNCKIKLPSSVFASEVEEEVGMLNKAAPQPGLRLDLDPDIVAAMDEDFDFDNPDNELEDDFVAMADGVATDEESGVEYVDDEDEEGSDKDWETDEEHDKFDMESNFSEEETKSRFTQYSMTSSVIRRNEKLTMLDEKFEQMFAEYDDNEIGALDCEEIEGNVDMKSDLLMKYAEEFSKANEKQYFEPERKSVTFKEYYSDESDEEFDRIEVQKKPEWDCESILSTHSNLYNHPKLIEEPTKIKVDRRGVPILAPKLTAKALAQLGEGCKPSTGPGSLASAVSLLSIRSKDESAEEKKQRKKAFREHKSERRIERKMNKEAFKEEKKKMTKIMLNNKLNLQRSIV
ncbi:protein LTV1 homolog isoform X2 [Nilaparvata lugens]|uniref:protein LTV1 homolog isoform X1 n=1 Tax=Nilaparvata lugens TaxID=108931 RepID=UPI00193CC550|nr:protein LTV1 homolog isoform X1 [Nilaparvata lugens]XP_039294044.1 protein LTV1 homolog isoform X2 [Nilaparvata lugens]